MKLNSKRTILVGLAFLSISAFWQMYDSVMNLILTGTFHLNETLSGAIMAADNILALFLLPCSAGCPTGPTANWASAPLTFLWVPPSQSSS